MKEALFELWRSIYNVLMGLIFWPACVKLLWDMYTGASLDWKQQGMIQTFKALNRDAGSKAFLSGQLYGAITSMIIGIALSWMTLTVVGAILLVISATEKLLRLEAEKA